MKKLTLVFIIVIFMVAALAGCQASQSEDKEDASQAVDYNTFKKGAAKRSAEIVEYMIKSL